jgi:outer membrane scaffolding protein for murein synthesis (MipA/OmpV family)
VPGAWLLALMLTSLAAAAQDATEAPAQDTSALPAWELGAFALGVSQQAYPGSDQQVNRALPGPFFIYRGRYFRVDRETAGLRAIKTDTFEFDIGVAGAFGSNSSDIDARRGMPDLGTLIEFGPRIKWNLTEANDDGRWRLELPLRGVFDLNDGAAHRGMSFEPELAYLRRERGGWSYSLGVSAIFADQRLARTFYEVAPQYALPDRPAYSADAGLVAWRLNASFSRSLGADWRLFGFARLNTVEGAANQDSPLVRQNAGATVGLGIAYTWLRSERPASD